MIDWNYKGNIALVTLENGTQVWVCGFEQEIRERFEKLSGIKVVKIDYNEK